MKSRILLAALCLCLLTSCASIELREAHPSSPSAAVASEIAEPPTEKVAEVPEESAPIPENSEVTAEPAADPDDDLDALLRLNPQETLPEAETELPPDPPAEPEPDTLSKPKGNFHDVSVSFVAAGDNLIHPNIYIDAGLRGTAEKEYDFLPMYEYVAEEFRAADIAFINQETVMAGAEYGYSGWPCFNCPRQLGLDMVSMGIDIVNIANNHMLDKGASGLSDTLDFWDTQPVTILGGYKDAEDASTIRTTEADGVTFAWLSYTLHTNGIVKPESSPLVIPYIDDDLIVSDLAKAREIGDFVIVSIHWGDENTQEPNAEQRRLAQLIADNGADLILGHHSHTLQPLEWIETDRGPVLCIFSLGNFVSGMAQPVNQVGGMLHFTVASDENGDLGLRDIEFHPTVFYYGMDWYNTKLYPIDMFTAEIAATHGTALSGYRLTPEDARRFVTNVIPLEYLPESFQQ